MRLDRYFAQRFSMFFLGIAGVFFLIMVMLDFIDQVRRFGTGNTATIDLLVLSLLSVPQAFYAILPLIVLLSAVALFLALARSSEMVVTRASGRSALRALWAPVGVTAVIGILAVAILNPIVAGTSTEYEARQDALRGNTPTLGVGASGLWLRQGTTNEQTVIRASAANLDGTRLSGVTFLRFGPGGGPDQRIEAQTAQLRDGAWDMTGVKIWRLDAASVAEAEARILPSYSVPSDLTADQIRNSFGVPASIPIWDLPAFIDRLQSAGLSGQRHLVWMHSEFAQPLFLIAMVLIGAAFTVRHQRGGRTGLMVLLAILLAFVIYFVRNFAQVLGENGDLPLLLSAYATPIAAIGLALGLLLHHEDG